MYVYLRPDLRFNRSSHARARAQFFFFGITNALACGEFSCELIVEKHVSLFQLRYPRKRQGTVALASLPNNSRNAQKSALALFCVVDSDVSRLSKKCSCHARAGTRSL